MSLDTPLLQLSRPRDDHPAVDSVRGPSGGAGAPTFLITEALRREADRQIAGLIRRNYGDCREITELLRRVVVLE
jgi:hypothetical protein